MREFFTDREIAVRILREVGLDGEHILTALEQADFTAVDANRLADALLDLEGYRRTSMDRRDGELLAEALLEEGLDVAGPFRQAMLAQARKDVERHGLDYHIFQRVEWSTGGTEHPLMVYRNW